MSIPRMKYLHSAQKDSTNEILLLETMGKFR